MTSQNAVNLPTVWDTHHTSDDPAQGTEIRLITDTIVTGREKTPRPAGKQDIVIGHAEAWRRLEAGAKPQWLKRQPGEPKPPQPFVPEDEFVTDLSGKKVNPWRYVHYIYLLDAKTGTVATFVTDSVGGAMAVDELSQQIIAMQRFRGTAAVPVVELKVVPFRTRFGVKKRPHFEILGWRTAGGGDQAPALVDFSQQEDPTAETLDDEIPF